MAEYEIIKENVTKIGEIDGRNLWRPKYRCQNCSKAIQKQYLRTSGECYHCNEEDVAVGNYISKVFAMTFYASDAEYTEFEEAIFDLKDELEYVSEFTDILEKGFNEYSLSNSDLIVVPPSGTAESDEQNHMKSIGESVSERVGIPFRDITYKKEDYPSQKGLGTEERLENVKGKIGCTETDIEADNAVVVDDIATSCATLSATAQALVESGVDNVKGLVIARDEDLSNLQYANVLAEVKE
ncbi:ComF family protein [Haloarcula hispanica]|uniref:ComF family protein n=1 Tax=Haloarcula hispanica TaxID=51589 RepID=A0A5J5LNK6_HALHI|nr:ComF family protein [Haloarcula hispanica]KAA9410968.1 ComF family protein [Haloarcula hispanica]